MKLYVTLFCIFQVSSNCVSYSHNLKKLKLKKECYEFNTWVGHSWTFMVLWGNLGTFEGFSIVYHINFHRFLGYVYFHSKCTNRQNPDCLSVGLYDKSLTLDSLFTWAKFPYWKQLISLPLSFLICLNPWLISIEK